MPTKSTNTATSGTGTNSTQDSSSTDVQNKTEKDATLKMGNATVEKSEMKNAPLHKFFVDALKDIYYAEDAIVKAL
ncbi:hypothetical protein IX39_20450, partial [Chryseobacterium formosense]